MTAKTEGMKMNLTPEHEADIRSKVTPLNYAAGYTAMKHIADAAPAKDSSHE